MNLGFFVFLSCGASCAVLLEPLPSRQGTNVKLSPSSPNLTIFSVCGVEPKIHKHGGYKYLKEGKG